MPNGNGTVRMHNVVPRFSETPGEIRWSGGALGQDNAAVFGELGLTSGISIGCAPRASSER